MRILYTLGIYCYTFGIRVAAMCGHGKAGQMVRGWREWRRAVARLDAQKPTVWFHAASLGEFEQARPVLEAYRERHPGHQVLLTFFSPSGYEVRKNYPLAEAVCYLPPDTMRNAGRLVNEAKPVAAYFVKYEFWYNYLGELRRQRVPTYLFSAIFREGQYFFSWMGRWPLRQLRECFTHLFVQDEPSRALLMQHGIAQVTVAGDTRFDRVQQVVDDPRGDEVVERWLSATGEAHVIVAGSSWEPDEELLAQYLDGHAGSVRIILAPHVISESHLQHIAQLFGSRAVRYSLLASGRTPRPEERVLVIDNMGLLSRLYRYATVAYIGGGYGVGIHNIVEALAYGKPVLFGPNYGKFKEARDIVGLRGGWSHSDYASLEAYLQPLLGDATEYGRAKEACLSYVRRNLGSTIKILNSETNKGS